MIRLQVSNNQDDETESKLVQVPEQSEFTNSGELVAAVHLYK